MAAHSSVLAWRNPGMGEPGGLPSMGLHRVGHDWSDLAAPAAQSLNWVVCCVIISSRLREKNCFMWLRLRNVKEKKVCPFLLLENSRPLSLPWEAQTPLSYLGTPDFLSTCLGIDSLNHCHPPPSFSFRRIWLPREKGHHSLSVTTSCCPGAQALNCWGSIFSWPSYWGVSDPGAPSNNWRRLCTCRSLDNHL